VMNDVNHEIDIHKDLKMCCGISMDVECGWTFNSLCDTRFCWNYLVSVSCKVILYQTDVMFRSKITNKCVEIVVGFIDAFFRFSPTCFGK
jgi:hypothetical protein